MDNDLKLNILQDFIDMNGGTFKLKVKWYDGKLYIDREKGYEGGVVHFKQMPLSPTIESELKKDVLKQMKGLRKIEVNRTQIIKQKVKNSSVLSLHNKFEQSIDFDLVLNSNRPATIDMYTYHGIQRLKHDYTYVRALFTTNPYLATVFNGIRIVPYQRDIEKLGREVIQTVKKYAQKKISEGVDNKSILQFKVEKAFAISFYLNEQEITEELQQMMNQKDEYQTTLDEFRFIAYLAYYEIFEGNLNNYVTLDQF